MNEVTISAPRSALRAMINLSAKDDIRYYINAVCLETLAGSTECRLIATDGRALGVYRFENETESAETRQFILPRNLLSKIKKGKRLDPETVNIFISNDSVTVDLKNGEKFTDKLVDAKYPDYRHVMVRKTSGDTAQFDPEITSRFYEVAKELGFPKAVPAIGYNGNSGATVDIGIPDTFCGVIMPIRNDPEKQSPAWVFGAGCLVTDWEKHHAETEAYRVKYDRS